MAYNDSSSDPGVKIIGIIVGGFVLIAFLIGWFSWSAETRRNNARGQAYSYVREMHPTWTEVRVQCQSSDSDGNDYVTCTVGDGHTTEAIECREYIGVTFNRGCRPMRYGFGVPQ